MKEIMDAFTDPKVKYIIVVASAQVGKAVWIGTLIRTPDGWKQMGDIEVGDTVFDENEEPCTVTLVTEVMYDHECYDITFSDGSHIIADAEHSWPVKVDGKVQILTTEEIKVPAIISGEGENSRTAEMVDIRKTDSVPVRCIQVDSPSRLYLVGESMIPTHNTESILNMLGYMIDQDPGPALYCVPTKEFAEDFSKRRITPMIRDTIPLSEKVAETKAKSSGNTIMKKVYPGGMISLIGSNSPADLSGTPARYVFADEIDRWAKSAGTEGDPWGLLKRATITFYNSKMIAVSTPTLKKTPDGKGGSKIAELFDTGTKERWSVQCPHCGEYNYITFKQIRFKHKKIETEGEQVQFLVSDICYVCPSCGGTSTEREVKRAPKKWIAEAPEAINNGTRSFWINGFYSPWNSWEAVIQRFLTAKAMRNYKELQVIYNTLFGELWDDQYGLEDISGLLSRREDYAADLPDGVLCLTMGIDSQDDWMQYEVVGYGFHGESWGIDTGKILGKPSDDAVWNQIDDLLDKEWEFADGTRLKISLTFVDMGGHYSQEIRERCAERVLKKVFCVHGLNDINAPYTSPPNKIDYSNPRTNQYGKCWHYPIGVSAGKEHIMHAISLKEPGPKYCHFPKGRNYDENYFNSLLSEKFDVNEKGKAAWLKITLRNESLDCRNYANAAFTVLNPNMDKLKADLTGLTGKKKKKAAPRKRVFRADIYGRELL